MDVEETITTHTHHYSGKWQLPTLSAAAGQWDAYTYTRTSIYTSALAVVPEILRQPLQAHNSSDDNQPQTTLPISCDSNLPALLQVTSGCD
ncbi:unnamed protein product [Ceratitis capitata]|uniref:(Mediterranean fruit fly) hypothetical protein n=1 Tax=Ceratitis capitata TaxID=7213 RepID=A0A811UJN4_CERCA|nr:unnamed protein product [Ceratitis capitata]